MLEKEGKKGPLLEGGDYIKIFAHPTFECGQPGKEQAAADLSLLVFVMTSVHFVRRSVHLLILFLGFLSYHLQ